MRLAIITTHPIQYYAPLFKLLNQQDKLNIMVFYTWGKQSIEKHDPGFGKTIKWDIDLLDGYNYQWVNNTANDPGSHHFKGITNPNLIGQINEWKPDTILIYGWAYQSHLIAMRYFKSKIPVLFRGDSTLLDKKSGFKNLLRNIYLKWAYMHIDYALYAGSNNKAYFEKCGLQNNQLVFAPHAVDNSRFALSKADEVLKLKHQLNINDANLLIVFAGKLEEKKDPILLMKGFINLNISNIHLLFVGNGSLEQQLKQQARSYQNIHFMDFQNQTFMPVIYQACDIFCLPSKGPAETWGLAVNEAMACSKAILVSDKVGCAIDLVKAGYNGQAFEAQSLTSLTQNLTLLISKGKKGLADMGHHSKTIIDNWTIQKQVEAIGSVILKHA